MVHSGKVRQAVDVAAGISLGLVIIVTIARGFQQDSSSTDSGREKDVYAIYSLMLTHLQTSHGPDHNERYLIAPATVPGNPKQPCVRPPKEREADFQEVLADYERGRAAAQQLKRAFSIQKPYVLLSSDEVREFIEERLSEKEPARQQR